MARINATASDGVRVEGLNEVNRALRALGGRELQGELKQANKDVAQFVANDARAAAYSLGGVAAHVAPSIGASGTVTRAGVSFGSGHPEAAGAAFGGQGRPTTQQFKPWLRAGYFPYPQIRADGPRIESEYLDAINKLLKRNGLA